MSKTFRPLLHLPFGIDLRISAGPSSKFSNTYPFPLREINNFCLTF